MVTSRRWGGKGEKGKGGRGRTRSEGRRRVRERFMDPPHPTTSGKSVPMAAPTARLSGTQSAILSLYRISHGVNGKKRVCWPNWFKSGMSDKMDARLKS
jgi:hypothetical protein